MVESRNRNGCGKMEAVEFRSSDPWTVLPVLAATEKQIGKRVECVAIDEGQFVQDLFAFTERLLERGYDVMVSGLELDFRGHAVRGDAGSVVAGADLLGKYYGAGGVLQLRGQGAVSAAAGGRKASALRQPDYHGRRQLRAALRGAFCAAGKTALGPCYACGQLPGWRSDFCGFCASYRGRRTLGCAVQSSSESVAILAAAQASSRSVGCPAASSMR